MKLGLIRHFKVITNETKLLSPNDFSKAMENYDLAPVLKNNIQINNNEWEICYCSTLLRAVITAETIYKGKIIKTDLIKEVPISPFTDFNIKLPAMFWHIGARMAWYRSHKSQIENISGTKERIKRFYDIIVESGYNNILIVSHGYFLRMFYEELKKSGFRGEVDINILNGKLYRIVR